jgi:uncharacterized DUF497 family protein
VRAFAARHADLPVALHAREPHLADVLDPLRSSLRSSSSDIISARMFRHTRRSFSTSGSGGGWTSVPSHRTRAAIQLSPKFHAIKVRTSKSPSVTEWFLRLGRTATGRVLIMAYTLRRRDGESIRIISARRASRKERAAYATAPRK